jgi:hypothetical protein
MSQNVIHITPLLEPWKRGKPHRSPLLGDTLPGPLWGPTGGTRARGRCIHRRDVRAEAVTGPPEPRAYRANRGIHRRSNILIRTALLHEQPQRSPFVER